MNKQKTRRQLMMRVLLQTPRAKDLSDATLEKIIESMDAFFTTVEEAYQEKIKLRDKCWQHSMKLRSIRKGKINGVIQDFNVLWENKYLK